MSDKRLVRLQRVAELYEVEHKVIRRAVSDGHVKGYKLPGSRLIYIDLNEFEAAIKTVPAVTR